MPVYSLDEALWFPDPNDAEAHGLLAIGGDLSTERLLLAYRHGIFPWYSDNEPILWFSPDPRVVLYPSRSRLDRSARRTLARAGYRLTMDRAFDRVIRLCAGIARKGQRGTWITADMIEAYCRLHETGFAHSVEAWDGGELVGGLYGVGLGRYFAGESMFRLRDGASLLALVALLRQLAAWGFTLFDCQVPSAHVARMGAVARPRRRFLEELRVALQGPTRRGAWRFEIPLGLSLTRVDAYDDAEKT